VASGWQRTLLCRSWRRAHVGGGEDVAAIRSQYAANVVSDADAATALGPLDILLCRRTRWKSISDQHDRNGSGAAGCRHGGSQLAGWNRCTEMSREERITTRFYIPVCGRVRCFSPVIMPSVGRVSLPEDRPKRRKHLVTYFRASGKNFSGSTRWSRM